MSNQPSIPRQRIHDFIVVVISSAILVATMVFSYAAGYTDKRMDFIFVIKFPDGRVSTRPIEVKDDRVVIVELESAQDMRRFQIRVVEKEEL